MPDDLAFNNASKTTTRPARMRKYLFISLVFLIASACTVKTLYNQLDWLIVDYLEDHVELSSEQQVALYKHLDDTLHWHKATQLPRYAEWLQDFKHDVQNKLTYAKATENLANFRSYLRTLRVRTAEEMTILLPTLTAAQREELYASLAEKNNEFADEFIHISRQEQIETYIERMEDRFEAWLGSLTEQQEQLIRASAVNFKPIAPETLKTRRRWQVEFKTALDKHKDTATTGKAMHELFVNGDRLRSDHYKTMLRANQQVLTRLIVSIANSLTKDQQRYFYSRVDDYIRHFTELAEEAKPTMASQE